MCPSCGTVHHLNPLLAVGTAPYMNGRVLLCKRTTEPKQDLRTLSAGFMEPNETVAQSAARETREEASAEIELDKLFRSPVYRAWTKYTCFVAHVYSVSAFKPSHESLDMCLFFEAQIPWDQLVLFTVRKTLQLYFQQARSSLLRVNEDTVW